MIKKWLFSHFLNLGTRHNSQTIINQKNEVRKDFSITIYQVLYFQNYSTEYAVKSQTPCATRNSQLECIKTYNENRSLYLMINDRHEEVIEKRIVNIINNT